MPTSSQPPIPGNGLVVDADGVSLDVNPADATIAVSGSGIKVGAVAGSNMPAAVQTRYRDLCALLEPLAIEPLQYGTFSYAVAAGVTKYLLSGWNLRIGSSGRIDTRDVHHILPLSGVTLVGISNTTPRSVAALIDPTLPTYTDAFTLYHTRLNYLAQNTPLYLPITSAAVARLLPGPYGAIVLNVSNFNFAWIGLRTPIGDTTDLALQYEVSDAQAVRYSDALIFPVSKYICSGVESFDGTGTVLGSLFYINLPSTWGAVTDPTTYVFRDDFMGASLDTATIWTRAQGTVGNVEINTDFQWCKLIGKNDGTWGSDGAYTQSSVARSTQPYVQIDFTMAFSTSSSYGFMVGWSDGGGHSYTNFAHGLLVQTNSTFVAFENGNNRGAVGSGFSKGAIYRLRIQALSGGGAAYQIQGGTEYAALGGTSWTTITPGTTTSATNTLHAGFAAAGNDVNYVGDVKIY